MLLIPLGFGWCSAHGARQLQTWRFILPPSLFCPGPSGSFGSRLTTDGGCSNYALCLPGMQLRSEEQGLPALGRFPFRCVLRGGNLSSAGKEEKMYWFLNPDCTGEAGTAALWMGRGSQAHTAAVAVSWEQPTVEMRPPLCVLCAVVYHVLCVCGCIAPYETATGSLFGLCWQEKSLGLKHPPLQMFRAPISPCQPVRSTLGVVIQTIWRKFAGLAGRIRATTLFGSVAGVFYFQNQLSWYQLLILTPPGCLQKAPPSLLEPGSDFVWMDLSHFLCRMRMGRTA